MINYRQHAPRARVATQFMKSRSGRAALSSDRTAERTVFSGSISDFASFVASFGMNGLSHKDRKESRIGFGAAVGTTKLSPS